MHERRTTELARALTDAVTALPAPDAMALGFGAMADHDAACSMQRSQARTMLLAERLLAELPHDQPIVLMKGLEVSQLYPIAAMRPFRDVDILVTDADRLWRSLVARGFRQRASRRLDLDHHHLPALKAPYGSIAVEVHTRPNVPAWAGLGSDVVLASAVPSRTGIEGILRPRDDVHALLMACHAWKAGFTRPRDLYDAALLAAAAEIDVDATARALKLAAFWRGTTDFTRARFLPDHDRRARLARAVMPHTEGTSERKRVRLVAPFLVANPARVVRGHATEFVLGRQARRARPPSRPSAPPSASPSTSEDAGFDEP
jgi:hypothetical protein